jgi:high-affinity Fe2+/Pb2+ permease
MNNCHIYSTQVTVNLCSILSLCYTNSNKLYGLLMLGVVLPVWSLIVYTYTLIEYNVTLNAGWQGLMLTYRCNNFFMMSKKHNNKWDDSKYVQIL